MTSSMTSDDLQMPKEMFNKQYSLVFIIVQRYAIFLMLQSNYCSKWLSFLMPPDSGKTFISTSYCLATSASL